MATSFIVFTDAENEIMRLSSLNQVNSCYGEKAFGIGTKKNLLYLLILYFFTNSYELTLEYFSNFVC
jgi:hypothetical protein